MPTIIDSLVVTLGLDPSKWKEGQAEADRSVAKTRDAAQKGAGEWESLAKKADDHLRSLQTQALKLAGIFLGGLGIEKAITDFARLNAETGRAAHFMKLPPDILRQWEIAGKTVGATAEEIRGSLNALAAMQAQWQMGLAPQSVGVLRSLLPGVDVIGMRPDAIMRMIAEKRANLDPAMLAQFMSMIGAGPGMMNLVSLGGAGLNERLNEAKEVSSLTGEMVKNAREMEHQWELMLAAANSIKDVMANWAAPKLTEMFNEIKKLMVLLMNVQPPTSAESGWEEFKKITVRDVWRFMFGGGAPAGAAAPGGAAPGAVRTKVGAGTASPAMEVLAAMIQSNVPGVDRFTAFNDALHAGRGAHGQGRALDFTLKDPSQSREVARQLREQLAAAGIDARVLDEYMHPSPGATGGHIHVQLTAAGAARLRERGAGGGVTIGTINVTSTAADLSGVATDTFSGAFREAALAAQANSGMH